MINGSCKPGMLCIISTKTPELSKQGQIVHCMDYFLGAKVCGKLKELLNFEKCEPLNWQFQKSKEENQIEQCNLGFSNNNCLARETCPNITCREGGGG